MCYVKVKLFLYLRKLQLSPVLGGPPNGTLHLTSEGTDRHYAVQVLSRFVLAYRLTEGHERIVKNTVISVMSPGYTTPDFEDIELLKAHEKGQFGILSAGKRDSAVLDAMTMVCGTPLPSYPLY